MGPYVYTLDLKATVDAVPESAWAARRLLAVGCPASDHLAISRTDPKILLEDPGVRRSDISEPVGALASGGRSPAMRSDLARAAPLGSRRFTQYHPEDRLFHIDSRG